LIGNRDDFYWLYTKKIQKKGLRGIIVKPIEFGNNIDHYFGFGVIEKTLAESNHGHYICYDHRQGRVVDMRYGTIAGYDEKKVSFNNYVRTADYKMIIFVDYIHNKFRFRCNEEEIVIDIKDSNIDYAFAFEPNYADTKFSVSLFDFIFGFLTKKKQK
jgi:hypothetical protein